MKPNYCSKGQFPENNQYVLVRIINPSWSDNEDKYDNLPMRVVKFVKGITEEKRKKLGKSDRARTYKCGDVHGNNLKPYRWVEFGPGMFFGQEVDVWYNLTELEK